MTKYDRKVEFCEQMVENVDNYTIRIEKVLFLSSSMNMAIARIFTIVLQRILIRRRYAYQNPGKYHRRSYRCVILFEKGLQWCQLLSHSSEFYRFLIILTLRASVYCLVVSDPDDLGDQFTLS